MKTLNPLIGTTAMVSASALRVAVQIAILPIVGRILGPHAYGQIALVSPFIFFSLLLAESGLGICIVRAHELSKALEGTVFCFSVGVSLILIGIFALLAHPLGHLLNEASFPALLMGMSSIMFLASLNVVPASLLLRAKRYGWMAVSDIASAAGGIVALVSGILLNWGVWSLVAQQIGFWVCKVMVVIIAAQWRPRFIFRWELFRQNINMGSNLTGSAVLSFIARNLDNILIGTFMGSEMLGYYALAFQIVGLPQMVLSGSVYYMIFSKTSEAQRIGQSSSVHFLKILRGVFLLSAPIMIGLAVTAPLSIPILLGDKWGTTIPLLVLLVPLGLCQTANNAADGVLIGLGRADIGFKLNLLSSTATIIAILIGVIFNSKAVAIGVSATALLGTFLILSAVAKECKIRISRIADAVTIPLISALLMGCVVIIAQRYLTGIFPSIMRLIISILIGAGTYGLILFGLFHDQLATDIADIRTGYSKWLNTHKK
jgi:PST family polysaccharide transporter